jgi:hypothetical protein
LFFAERSEVVARACFVENNITTGQRAVTNKYSAIIPPGMTNKIPAPTTKTRLQRYVSGLRSRDGPQQQPFRSTLREHYEHHIQQQ